MVFHIEESKIPKFSRQPGGKVYIHTYSLPGFSCFPSGDRFLLFAFLLFGWCVCIWHMSWLIMYSLPFWQLCFDDLQICSGLDQPSHDACVEEEIKNREVHRDTEIHRDPQRFTEIQSESREREREVLADLHVFASMATSIALSLSLSSPDLTSDFWSAIWSNHG